MNEGVIRALECTQVRGRYVVSCCAVVWWFACAIGLLCYGAFLLLCYCVFLLSGYCVRVSSFNCAHMCFLYCSLVLLCYCAIVLLCYCALVRSEERPVGKECTSRWAP